ncbi:hypothetical protein FIBSPDRAFT_912464 [Athelia psychrophila]|uniref:Signal recognition particle subunit SRP72 n=1 Tax=Athelia psychrophila TaxID=1759441 RepID=A0A166E8J7_9AGAM|nr:hypothetical protein FIBSPDRAFT_912464 [Fibularhizoctonia sp. CBS 109695]
MAPKPNPSTGPQTSAQRPTKSNSSQLSKERKAAASRPKQPTPVPERLKRLFTSLCAQIDGGHFVNAVKSCDKILRLAPGDKDALQTKLFLLLQTEQYGAALSLIGSDNDDSHIYAKTYSVYRLQHEAEATEGLDALKKEEGDEDVERGAMHLEAQLNYRRGSYQTAVDLYNDLLDTAEPNSEEHSDILTNLTAAQKHLDFINTEYLHAIDALPTAVTSTLETNPPPAHPSTSQATAAIVSSSSTVAPAPAQPKKARASRLPKGVVPGVTPPPDPERWLKKSERSTFGQGRKRKGGGGGGASQGSALEPSGGAVSVPTKSAVTAGKGKKKK